jgi:hypothetical protein
MRFCKSNMVPTFTGVAQVNGTLGTAGSLATNTYYNIVTASDTQNQYESRIYQVSQLDRGDRPERLDQRDPAEHRRLHLQRLHRHHHLADQPGPLRPGPDVRPDGGPGHAARRQPDGDHHRHRHVAQTPPAAPATGLTVYPTFVFGRGAYGQVCSTT